MDVLLRICQIASRIISGYHSYEEYITNVETSIVVVVENDVSRLSDGGNEADGAVHVIRLDTFHWANNVTADDLLSMIIWFVIQGCPSTLLFNLALMHKLRHPALFVAEERYYLTTLTSAAEFLYELKVSASLRMPDSGSRQTCIASCPEQHVARWIGDVWNTQGRCEATANSSLGGGEVDSMSTGVSTTLDNCRPLPSSFNIATMFLDAATYATFQKVLGHASCEIAVERLYQYIHHVLTITTPESDNFSVEEDAFPHMLLPVYVHQTISHCVRLVLKRHTTIFQSILNTYGATYDSDSKETIRNFKQKYFRIILLAESFERLLFTQIYDRLFPYIIKLPVSEDKPKSMFKTLTSGFSRSQEMFRKKAEILGRLIIPPFLSNRRSMGTDDEILDTTHFFETSQKLKALCCTSDFFDAFSSDHQNKTVLVIRRLSRLGEYTNPFEKLKTFVALRRVADCVASSRDGTDSSHVCAALAALLLVHTCPAHLVAHLTFTNEYRHPALCCVEAQDALNFTWFAMALVEEYWSKHDSKSLTYSTLLDQLILLNHMY